MRMKEWLTVVEAAYVVNRDKSRIYAWIDKGWLSWRRTDEGFIEVSSEDVQRVESVTKPGRPRRDTPKALR